MGNEKLNEWITDKKLKNDYYNVVIIIHTCCKLENQLACLQHVTLLWGLSSPYAQSYEFDTLLITINSKLPEL